MNQSNFESRMQRTNERVIDLKQILTLESVLLFVEYRLVVVVFGQ